MGFGSNRHTYANGHCNCYCHSYGDCSANRFFATEQSDRNTNIYAYRHTNSYGDNNRHGFAYGYSLRYAAMRA